MESQVPVLDTNTCWIHGQVFNFKCWCYVGYKQPILMQDVFQNTLNQNSAV